MKISREIRVGVLALICLFLLYFGFKFLKGTNIFNPTHSYTGRFTEVKGLVEQAPVYVRGYKVGQVETVSYDYSLDTAFTVLVSLNKDIRVTEGSRMLLVPDGLMGGMAVELAIPAGKELAEIPAHSELPTGIQTSLIDDIQSQLLATLDSTLTSIRQLAEQVNSQLDGDKVKTILANVEDVTMSLKGSSRDLQRLLHGDMPRIVAEVDSILDDVQKLAANVSEADIAALMVKADSTLNELTGLIASANNADGTIGLLLNDRALYDNLNTTFLTADSLMSELREEPNSIIWGKKKSKELRREARRAEREARRAARKNKDK